MDESNTVERWALAPDGMWLTELPDQNSEEGQALPASIYEDAANALEITNIHMGLPRGEILQQCKCKNALSIIDGMTTELADQIKRAFRLQASNSTVNSRQWS